MAEMDTSQFPSTARRREPREYSDSLYSTDYYDWNLFMWLASLKEIRNFIYLFIAIWDTTSLRNRKAAKLSQELTDETSKITSMIKELVNLKALSNEQKETYDKTLDEYKNSRLNEKNEIRKDIARNVWKELIDCGLPGNSFNIAEKLNYCSFDQKESLRQIVFSRMDSFRSFAKQIQTKKETKDILGQETVLGNQPHDTNPVQDNNIVTTKISVESNEITKLRQENGRLLAELDQATDPEWRDNNENNSMQLVEDIKSLNRALNKITGVKRDVKEIKTEAVAALFSSLNCTTNVEDNRMKLVLDAALQQHLIKSILKSAKDYFNLKVQENAHISEDKLEAAILSKTEELIELTNRFEETRSETEEVSRTLSTKLRQQSYAALGYRGFSNLNHLYIKELAKKLIDEMNKYRIIESEEKNKNVEKKMIEIIIQVLRIFWFRIKTQEPIPKVKFYKGGKDIDPDFMEGTWDGHYEDYEVEVCSFPAVFTKSDGRVYTKAKVIERQKKRKFKY
ncbi:hypothetical protein C1645_833724 [Glomus cerebriforme]|uniref:Uncharacterized protein n=1 Tax=Glomus cerebriforme TaxID=658196 RepID=A0A397SHQ8_9GLOM|nr:hypothetical protein C1645_833724 [Glomus cerebriforme]